MTGANDDSEVDPSTPTAAELRRDVLNRERPAPEGDRVRDPDGDVDAQRADDRREDDGAFADSDDGALARHPFDLGGES